LLLHSENKSEVHFMSVFSELPAVFAICSEREMRLLCVAMKLCEMQLLCSAVRTPWQ